MVGIAEELRAKLAKLTWLAWLTRRTKHIKRAKLYDPLLSEGNVLKRQSRSVVKGHRGQLFFDVRVPSVR